MNQEQKKSTGIYWIYTLISLAACIGFLMIKPEWFWVTLPFLGTSIAKAFDAI